MGYLINKEAAVEGFARFNTMTEIAESNAAEALDQAAAYDDAWASYLINALDTLEEKGIRSMYRPQMARMYDEAYKRLKRKAKKR